MKVAVIGGGGFIGTNVIAALPDAKIIEWGEPLDFRGCDAVVHLAANADVRRGWENPKRDIESNLLLTSEVLEAMRRDGVKSLIFPSTGSVYAPSFIHNYWLKESDELRATSLYAASKIAAEQLIAAYCAAGHIRASVIRLVSVLGPHYTHGLIFDFMKKLREHPEYLDVVGPGTTPKSYVHVADVVRAIRLLLAHHEIGIGPAFGVYNVGTNETMTPLEIAAIVVGHRIQGVPEIRVVGQTWIGDNPNIQLDCTKLRALGWEPRHRIADAVKDTAEWLRENSDVEDIRPWLTTNERQRTDQTHPVE